MDNELLKNLSEESMVKIQEAIESKVKEKVSIHVEKALTEQDELYSQKLEQLLKSIDKDHTTKLQKVVEAIDADRTEKLKMVIEKYEMTLSQDAKNFKTQIIESISDYLETYLDEKVPAAEIKEAVRNKKAITVLESLRSHLAVDAALQKESIKEAIIDGKNQISEASNKLESVINENAQLKFELDKVQAALLIEQKSALLDEQQKKYIKKVMNGKNAQFINENFDYTVKLFAKKSNDRLETLKEEALSESTNVDRVVLEQTQNDAKVLSPYLSELSKY
jgi:regulator of replication initiation timing